MKLEDLIWTAQQEAGLADFRKDQEENEYLTNDQFQDWYFYWQYEKGYSDDSYAFNKV